MLYHHSYFSEASGLNLDLMLVLILHVDDCHTHHGLLQQVQSICLEFVDYNLKGQLPSLKLDPRNPILQTYDTFPHSAFAIDPN